MTGNRLRELRLQNKITCEYLANILGTGKSTVSKWENNQLEPDNEMMKLIAEYFNVSTDYLLGRTDDPRPFPVEDTRTIDEKLQDSDFAYALYEGSKELSDAEKEEILNLFEYVKSKHKR